ncbi:ABC-type spermidine/putrescine transport system permease subunit I [Orbus hercynius]|uniref:ABC-type spermidine/putrescine transport system permease subunit I n=2 Tax=Orbus hercynius TaxID=593135 RepID=A0A495RJH3_9GAMM|nr:putrescine ABC transporter permease PotH [Orbus hercynius]RKS87692.1 ABC-type spermidine/putrescine transport system permease subunit I [Orbus hercynius]
MRIIGSCVLFNVFILLCAYVSLTNHQAFEYAMVDLLFTVMVFGLLVSLVGLFLTQYKATRLSYWVIIVGFVMFLPTLIPVGAMGIYYTLKRLKKLRDDSDLMTSYGRLLVTSIPYLWMLLLFLLPFLIVFKISFAEMVRAIPPYTDLVNYEDGIVNIALNVGNYLNLIDDTIYIDAYLQSLKIACISTFLCILIGYPLAWAITQCQQSTRNILLLLVILPSWTSFLIRVYAWMGILKNNGLLNNFLIWLGVIDDPLIILNTNLAVYIGIVYSYLPFVVLPIYTSLSKIDTTLVEAALDLGCKPIATFFKIIVPLTKSGVIAGGMLVFIPAVGEYVIPELLGGSDTLMIGKQLWLEFFNNRDWPAASAVASVMLLILIVPIFYFNKFQNKQMGGTE